VRVTSQDDVIDPLTGQCHGKRLSVLRVCLSDGGREAGVSARAGRTSVSSYYDVEKSSLTLIEDSEIDRFCRTNLMRMNSMDITSPRCRQPDG